MNRPTIVVAGIAAAGIAALAWAGSDGEGRERPRVSTRMHGASAGAPAPNPEDVIVPAKLSGPAMFGQLAFENSCATCHGKNGAGGTGKAPPLIHPIYEPGHHPDSSFVSAATKGVQAHHWGFGNMPPVTGITVKDVELIALYIREIQRANGIE